MSSRRDFIVNGATVGAAVVSVGLLARLSHAQAVGYVAGPVSGGGAITGTLKINGKAPEPDRFIIGKDSHVCGDGHAAHDTVALAANAGITNAVVALAGIQRGLGWAANHQPGIVQEKCTFRPYLQVAAPGAELVIHNKDPLLHNIHAYELVGRARRTLFNVAQPQAGQIDRHKLELRRGHIVEIDCDAHNWMSAWVYVSEHPYVTVTGDGGGFRLKDIPAGSYELIAWHPLLGTSRAPVTVADGREQTLELQLGAA
jgi:hypothetical protein